MDRSCVVLKMVRQHMPVLKLVAGSLKMNEENVDHLVEILEDFIEYVVF